AQKHVCPSIIVASNKTPPHLVELLRERISFVVVRCNLRIFEPKGVCSSIGDLDADSTFLAIDCYFHDGIGMGQHLSCRPALSDCSRALRASSLVSFMYR